MAAPFPTAARRQVARLAAALAVIVGLLGAAPALPAASSGTPAAVTVQRVGGADRYATAAAAAQDAFPGGTQVAVLARGDDYPDALAAAPLAASLHAALLLTRPASLPTVTQQALTALGVQRVIVLGGDGAVSQQVADQLASAYQVQRIGGADRYATAAAIARELASVGPLRTSSDGADAVFVTGLGFADAVVAGAPASAATPMPILLVRPGSVPDATASAVSDLGIGTGYVLGGVGAVSGTVANRLAADGVAITRVAGADRFGTAVAVAQQFAGVLGGPSVVLARGDTFPDALVAGWRGGLFGAPVLLARSPTVLGYDTTAYLLDRAGSLGTLLVIGGPAAIDAPVATEAADAAAGTAPPGFCADQTLHGMTDAQLVGQLFMVGVDAATGPSSAVRRDITTYHVGSVTLSGRSSAGVTATHALTQSLQSLATSAATAGVPLFVATDQEGGEVQVLSGPGFSDIPTALDQGQLAPSTLRQRAATWGSQLAAAGVNVDLAPVMDVVPESIGQGNAPIGRYDREFGYTPSVVSAHGVAFARGMADAGIDATLKHFPGLGRASGNTDTTYGVTDTVTTRHDAYLAPFAAGVDAGAPFVMVSTALYTRIDSQRLAAFSPTVIKTMLRGDLGFTGVVISDSLDAASVSHVPVGRRATDFIGAGGDLALTVDASLAPAMVNAVLDLARADSGFRGAVHAAALRVLTAKEDAGLLSCG